MSTAAVTVTKRVPVLARAPWWSRPTTALIDRMVAAPLVPGRLVPPASTRPSTLAGIVSFRG